MKYLFSLLLASLLAGGCQSKKEAPPTDPDIYYTCSMDPQVKENKPGKCPICKMELTPVKKSGHSNQDEIALSAQQIRLGNIHTDTIRDGSVGEQLVLPATLNFDQASQTTISARIAGRVERLYFKNTGAYVAKGEKLYDLYSEELNNAKQEYLLLAEKQKKLGNAVVDFDQLIRGAKNKLLLWGMTEGQIQELAKEGKASPLTSFYSNAGGTILSVDTKEGDYITEGGTVMRLAGLSTLWAEAQVYSSQLSSMERNSQALVRIPEQTGNDIKGRIDFVNPEINPDTRINLIRVSIPNTGNQLRPGMQAYVLIRNHPHSSLSLPEDAVIRDNRGASVWVRTAGNTFKNKMVETGLESNDRIEIKSGLQPGDIVVISGAYLLNSEYIFKRGTNPMEGMKM